MAERYVKAEKITDKFTQAQIHTRSNSQGEENPQHAEPDLDWKAGKKEWAIVIVLAIVSLMIALDATILVTALPAIASKLDGSATDTFWTGTSYLLTESVFQPFIVTLSDSFGRLPLYLVSLGFFTAGTLLCCLAQSFPELLAGRSIQGVGGGGILSLGLVILTDIIPLRQRPVYVGVNQISWALGTITGPLIGGLFAQHATWRWIFYINFPFCAIGFLAVPLVLKLHVQRATIRERLRHVDWIGAFLFIGSMTSFLVGMTFGGVQFPWRSPHTLVPLIIGAVGIAATILWERFGAAEAFLRLSIFDSYSALAAYTGATLQGLLMFCELYYIPFYLESVKNYSPTDTGLAVMPITVSLIPTSVIIGRLITRFGTFRWALWLGWLFTTLATGLLVLLKAELKTYAWVLIFVLIGIGHGFILMSLNFSIQAMADVKDVGYATAMYSFQRNLGMCIGVAVGGAVFQNRMEYQLAKLRLPLDIAKNAEGFLQVLKRLPQDEPMHKMFVFVYTQAFRNVFEVLIGIAALAGLLSLFVKKYTMDKELGSEHVLRPRNTAIPQEGGTSITSSD